MISDIVLISVLVLSISHSVLGFLGGKNATKKEIANVVSLRNVLRDNQLFGLGHHCGGAVLNKNMILTSANCLMDSTGYRYMLPGFIRVVGGTLNKDLMEETTFDATLRAIRPHPGYNFRSMAFNIAVVWMTKPVPDNGVNLKPINLALDIPSIGAKCSMAGWGKTMGPKEPVYMYAQRGEVNHLDMSNCEKFYKQIPANTLCFGALGVAVCQEDIGTVIMCDNKAVGIIALVDLCEKTNSTFPFVASSIPDFRQWIIENAAEDINYLSIRYWWFIVAGSVLWM